MFCETPLRFSRLPVALVFLLGFLASLGIGETLGLKAYQAPLWIPIFVLCVVLVAPLSTLFATVKVDSGPKVVNVINRNLVPFLVFWFASVVFVLIYGYVVGWVIYLAGGPRGDILEIADMWSIPVGWVSPAFIVRPEKSMAAVIGIVSANGYVWALGLTLVYRTVHHLLRRNRVTELGISGRTLDDDDDGPSYTIGS
jgi:hypothetical protein